MKRIIEIIVLAAAMGLGACAPKQASPWASSDAWYQTGVEVNPSYVDVFYIVSTNVWESSDASGARSLRAALAPAERSALTEEMVYIHDNIFPDSLNFFSPYYHQITMDGFFAPADEFQPAMAETEQECLSAFNYYMSNLNGGRPYILAGFSQGAMLVKSLLKSMSDEQFSNMIAAYVIGEELTADDLTSPHIVPATCADDRGVTISFNSVCDVDDTWTLVCSNPAACINPVNWCTDSTPAPLYASGVSLTVAVDPSSHVVVVTGYGDNPPTAPFQEPWPKGCLHHEEILIYAPSLSRNALTRAY